VLITYKTAQEGYEPQVNDECEVYLNLQLVWLKVVELFEDGHIRLEDSSGIAVEFRNREELFAAIAEV
jgi:hypothetical protein